MPRLTLSLLAVVLAAMVGLGWVLDQWYSHAFKQQDDPSLVVYKQLGIFLAQQLDAMEAPQQAHWIAQASTSLRFVVVGAADFPLPRDLQSRFAAGEPLLLDSGHELSWHFFLPHRQQVLSLPLAPELRVENNQQLRWLLTLLFYAGIIAVVLLWLYPLLRRLALMRRSARAFGAGDLAVRIAPGAVPYINDIEQEFNRMAQRIEQLIADNKLLSSGLSHDLRTPLARLRFGLDVLADSRLNELPAQQTLAHLNRDLEDMESLVDVFLQYARLEQSSINLNLEPLVFADLVHTQVRVLANAKLTLLISPAAQLATIRGNAKFLAMLCSNLLQNAHKYCREHLRVELLLSGETLVLRVEDDGPGIAPEERAQVLKPFYRAKAAQSFQGHGMGLALVDRIAYWHKAELLLSESEALGGVQVDLRFPVFKLNGL